jgi:cobalt-zinc-cadmium efflux system membrane fusion protein
LAAPGEKVKKGAPLLQLLSPDLGSARADQLKARADLTAAEHEVARQRELAALHASAQRDLEQAEDNYGKAKAEHERAALRVRLLRPAGAEAQDQAGVEAAALSQEYTLRSPIDGEVIARQANPGAEVQGQYSSASAVQELFTIGSLDQLWLLGDVYEVDLPLVTTGAEVSLLLPAFPGRPFTGTVDWISDTLDPVLRTAKVRCVLKNQQHLLKPEMYQAVTVATPLRRAVAVPRDAVLRQGDETIVFVEQPASAQGQRLFKRRRVTVNEQVPGEVVPVLAGLEAGERVAGRGSIFLLGLL